MGIDCIIMEHENLDSRQLRYIVFLIDSKIKDHSGKVFCSYMEAKEYTHDTIVQNYSDKAVIGMFYMNQNSKDMLITMIETIGFAGDKKRVEQLDLFQQYFS